MYIYKQNMLKSTIIVLSAIDGEETAGMIKHALLSPFPIQKQSTEQGHKNQFQDSLYIYIYIYQKAKWNFKPQRFELKKN